MIFKKPPSFKDLYMKVIIQNGVMFFFTPNPKVSHDIPTSKSTSGQGASTPNSKLGHNMFALNSMLGQDVAVPNPMLGQGRACA